MGFPKEKLIPDILGHITSLQTPRKTSILRKNWGYNTPEPPMAQMSKTIGAERMRLIQSIMPSMRSSHLPP